MSKSPMQKNSCDTKVYSFSNDISPKVDVITRLELELAYFEAAVQHFNHYTTGSFTWEPTKT